MINLILFAATTLVYWLGLGSLAAFDDHRINSRKYLTELRRTFLDKNSRGPALSMLGLVALLCLPLNINGNVFTVLGNVHSTGVKNAYSVFSLYLNAENNAYSLLGPMYQKTGRDAVAVIGFFNNQIAGRHALTLFGVVPYQKANDDALSNEDGDAFILAGLNGLQNGKNSTLFAGVSIVQTAKEEAVGGLAAMLIQESRYSALVGGFNAYQYSSERSRTYVGLTLIQNSEKVSENRLAMSIYQRAGNQSRAFAVWSKLPSE